MVINSADSYAFIPIKKWIVSVYRLMGVFSLYLPVDPGLHPGELLATPGLVVSLSLLRPT